MGLRRGTFNVRTFNAVVLTTMFAALLAATGCSTHLTYQISRLVFAGDSRTLRERPEGSAPNSPNRPALLILALDGIDRVLLYDMLRAGELPALATLLSAEGTEFPHAYFDESRIATLPSST